MKYWFITLTLTLILFSCKATEESSIKPVRLLVISGPGLKTAQVVQSQLKKIGIPLEIIEKKDYSSYLADEEAGNYDLAITGWTTVTGNPDYAVYSLFHSQGDYNNNGLNDTELDGYLEAGRASPIGSEEFLSAYANVEKLLNETPYIIPISYSKKTLAYTKDLETPILNKSRSFPLETVSWRNDSGKDNEIDPVRIRHATINLTSFDPAKANDGTVFALNTNLYSRLVNLDPEDNIVSGLAEAFASEDQVNFYFALQQDLKFSNGDTLEPSDIVFSLLRASNPELPGNRVYSVQSNILNVSESSWKQIPASVQSQLEDQLVDSSQRQIIHIETKNAYGQLYNMLAHTSGGIVSQKAVTAQGDDYGTRAKAHEVVTSGPYVVKAIDESNNEIIFERNENYYSPAKMKTVIFKVIPDTSASLLALESGNIDYVYTIPISSWQRIEDNADLGLIVRSSNGVSYIQFNLGYNNSTPQTIDPLFRKALYYAVDPNEIIQFVDQGNATPAASPLTPVLEGTGASLLYQRPSSDIEKAKEFLAQYQQQ